MTGHQGSAASAGGDDTLVTLLPDAAATDAFGHNIAAQLLPGDVLALSGEIGAGKTSLARAIVRAFVGDPTLDVPSPTFTLLQGYEAARGAIVHADLYRIAAGSELVELGFEELGEGAVLLVEWPDRAGDALGPERADIGLAIVPGGGDGRVATLTGQGSLADRLRRSFAIARLAESCGWADAERVLLQGDASSRAYERLVKPSGETAILMISPPRPDGPPVRRGKPYSAIARLAESVHAFAAMDRGLIEAGFQAPRILAENLDLGLLILEDFGIEPVAGADGPIPERYGEAIRLLAALHGKELPGAVPITPDRLHVIPPYDLDAMIIEVELLLDWYLPHIMGTQPSGSVRAEFGHAWRDTLASIVAGPQTWTLRDYHSPNLIWLEERQGIDRVGLLDFQDAVLGPPAYDVASLLQDARVTVPAELELRLLGVYAGARKAAQPDFDTGAFAASYAIMGAQRATKILGIFARLDRRDGKPQYLAHLPRIVGYLTRNLAHPALRKVRNWFALQMPDVFGDDLAGEAADGRVAAPAAEVVSAAPVEAAPTPADEPDVDTYSEPAIDPEIGAAAIVLAAGLGQRMRPITDTLPKPLVAIAGRPMLDHALDRLAQAGIGEVVVNVHHLADLVESHLVGRDAPAIVISDERDALLETGGGVKRALPCLAAEFVVMNSDSLWIETEKRNLTRMIDAWRPEEMDILLLLAARDSLGYGGLGDFEREPGEGEAGRLTRRPVGGEASLVYAGVAVMKAELFADTPDGAFSLNLLFDRAIAAGRLYGLALAGEWLHVGTPDAIPLAEARFAAYGDMPSESPPASP